MELNKFSRAKHTCIPPCCKGVHRVGVHILSSSGPLTKVDLEVLEHIQRREMELGKELHG